MRTLKNGKKEYKKGLYKYNPFDVFEIPTTAKGYFDVWNMIKDTEDKVNVYIIIGGRRLGKTYSCLKGVIQDNKRHMYVRRTQADLDDTLTSTKNPYRALEKDLQRYIKIIARDSDRNIVEVDEEDNELYNFGIASAISTSGSVRGAYLEDIEYLIYDEFINLKPTNQLKKKEGNLFFDLYDTANNDRDIRGAKPLKAILLSNANTTEDGVIRNLQIGQALYKMIQSNSPYCYIAEKKIYVAMLPSKNEITSQREKSAIGSLVNNTTYGDMALGNNFIGAYFGDIVDNVNYRDYRALMKFEDLYIYKEKGSGNVLVSRRSATVNKRLMYSMDTKNAMLRDWGFFFKYQYEMNLIRYSDYDSKLDFLNYFITK